MKLIVDGQTARLEETSQLVAGSVQVYTIDFEFDDSWDGYAKTAVFEPSFTDAYEQLIVDGQCTIPSEVLAQTGTLKIGVFGTSGTVTRPTMYAPPVYIEEGADTEANTPSSAQQSLYSQLVTLVTNASNWVTSNGANVLSHLSDAIKHITAAERSAWNAKYDKPSDGIPDSDLAEAHYTEAEADALLNGKQDAISDLDDIREGAALGETALQAVPETYRTAAAQDEIDEGKQDTISDLADIREGATQGAEAWREVLAAGNKAAYRRVMKQFFLDRGADTATPAELTAICCEWYNAIRTGWHGWTEFHQPEYSTSSYGTKYGDNAGLSCTSSTNAVANTDDYQGLPLFAITDVNWVLDSTTGDIVITAVDGITDGFERSNPAKFVGVMQMTGYHWRVENTLTYEEHYADYAVNSSALPLPEAIKLDGTVRPFVVHGKYMAGLYDGKMTCCSGQHPNTGYSHNSLITAPDNIGAMYSGGCITDWSFLLIMTYIKYGSMTQDGVNQGCVSYSYNYPAAVSETGVKRIVLTTSNGSKYVVGSTICLGTGSRGAATSWEIGKFCITSIESVTIDGTTYTALYVDAEDTFDTVAGVTLATTYHWISGSCDDVLGNDGSPTNAANGSNAAMIQGIEYSVGGYEVFADIINSIGNGYLTPYIAKRTSYQATSATANMVASTARIPQPATAGWQYVIKEGYDADVSAYSATSLCGTSSTYHRDGDYINDISTTTGLREWLAFGYLSVGSGFGGLCFLAGNLSLGNGYWYFLARLSPNGNRGELAA